MGKVALKTRNNATGGTSEYDLTLAAKVYDAKQQFIGATLNLGWKLAITVVVPIVVGVKFDERYLTSPLFTLVGMLLAAISSCAVVWATVKNVNKAQAVDRKVKRVARN